MVLAVAAGLTLLLSGGTLAGPAMMLWGASKAVGTYAAVSTAISVGAKGTSKVLYNDGDLALGDLLVDGGLAVAGLASAGVIGGKSGLLKGGIKALKSTKSFQALGRVARTGSNLSALKGVRTGVQVATGHVRTFADDVIVKAKPLIDKGTALKEKVLGTELVPTGWGMVHAGVRMAVPLDAGSAIKGELSPLWDKYHDDPLKIVRPVEVSAVPGAGPRVTGVPIAFGYRAG
ncbi:MAG: hypothetical protein ACRDY7_10065 [Acidimicrobiia bacterium]